MSGQCATQRQQYVNSLLVLSACLNKTGFSQLTGRKNGAPDEDTRVSLARPVLSSAHYFQAPVEVASKTLFESCSRAKIRFTVFCFFIASPTAMILVIHVLRRFFFCDRNLRGRSCLSRQRRDMSITSKGRCLEKVILNLSVSLLKV